MYRSAVIKEVNGYPDDYPALEDWACFMNMSRITELANIPEVLLTYEVSASSISSKKRFQQSKSKIKLLFDNYQLNVNQTVGLIKSSLILLAPRGLLTYVKTWVKNI